MNTLAQVFGLIGLIILIISIQCNNRLKILVLQIFANIFYGLQYFVLNSLSAALMNVIAIFRCIIFSIYAKNKKKIPVGYLMFLILMIFLVAIFTCKDIISLIPIVSTIIYMYATWQEDLRKYRFLYIIVTIGWIIFNIYISAYVALVGSVIELINGLIAIIRFDISKEKK